MKTFIKLAQAINAAPPIDKREAKEKKAIKRAKLSALLFRWSQP